VKKTRRIRGEVFRRVREFAATHENFTAADILSVTVTQARNALTRLTENGEVTVVQPAIPGRFSGRMAVYSPTPKIRAPELTNRWR
jgi:hypothetical protein